MKFIEFIIFSLFVALIVFLIRYLWNKGIKH